MAIIQSLPWRRAKEGHKMHIGGAPDLSGTESRLVGLPDKQCRV
jgi:hypothetical protein